MREHLRCKLFGHDYPPSAWSVGYPPWPHHTCKRCGFFNERLVPSPPPSPPRPRERCHHDGNPCYYKSDCAVHNEPAEPAGECDCGLVAHSEMAR